MVLRLGKARLDVIIEGAEICFLWMGYKRNTNLRGISLALSTSFGLMGNIMAIQLNVYCLSAYECRTEARVGSCNH